MELCTTNLLATFRLSSAISYCAKYPSEARDGDFSVRRSIGAGGGMSVFTYVIADDSRSIGRKRPRFCKTERSCGFSARYIAVSRLTEMYRSGDTKDPSEESTARDRKKTADAPASAVFCLLLCSIGLGYEVIVDPIRPE